MSTTSTAANRADSTRTVIVTGATSALGIAIAQAYLTRGYRLVLNGRSLPRLQQVAARLGHPDRLLLVEGDITQPATGRRLFERAQAAFGRVDILVNRAGVLAGRPGPDEADTRHADGGIGRVVDTRLKGFLYLSQAAAQHMGAQRHGHIVNITAGSAGRRRAGVPAMLQGLFGNALHHVIRGLAQELAASRVRVNAVAPDLADAVLEHDSGAVRAVVDAVLYLTEANFTTGIVLPVDGAGAGGPAWRRAGPDERLAAADFAATPV